MGFKIVEDGKFKVYESGFIERSKKGVYIPATMTHTRVGRNQSQSEMLVSYTQYGEQVQYYAKRLIADAFVPNENHYFIVDYIDGDYKNLNHKNLKWKSIESRNEKMLDTREKNATKCKNCDKKTTNWKHVCNGCLAKERENERLDKFKATKDRRINKAIKDFGSTDINVLKNSEESYVQKRLQGCTLEEIGNEFNVSKEWVRRVLNKVKERNA